MKTREVVKKGIIIDEPWIGKILAGEKSWEMRSKRTPTRGVIALVKKGTKTVVGVAELYECDGPHSLDGLRSAISRHCIPETIYNEPDYKWYFAWKLKNVRALKIPVPYIHKNGATVWVNLDDNAIEKIAESIDS
jgi:hypothetical protein